MNNDADTLEFIADSPDARLDKSIVAQIDHLSRTQVQTLIHDGFVSVDGAQVKASHKLKGGERIVVVFPARTESAIKPENIPLDIIYDDDDIAVIDKPAGLVVHPGDGNETGTLVHALLAHWPQIAAMTGIDERRKGIAHRLDKGTSGVILIVKHDRARLHLAAQFEKRTIEKKYLALLERAPQTATGRIEAPIGRDPKQRKRMAVVRGGKPALTEFTVVDRNFTDGRTLVEVNLMTGRTHQIRVHLAFIGCPIVGDAIYGFRKQRLKLKRQFLHAQKLCFDHPTSGERLCFECALPPGLQNILEKLRS